MRSIIETKACWIRRGLRSDYFTLFLIALAYIIIMSLLAVWSHNTFQTNAWDLGIYSQALYSTVNYGKALYYTAELPGNPSGSLFGIHFSPFLLILVPIYAIFQSPITLLVIRPIAVTIGLIPLYWIIRERLPNSRSFTHLLVAIYLIYPPVTTPFWNFDVEVFLPALFLFTLYYLERGRLLHSYFFIVLALMVNEFVSFIVIATALYYLLSNRREVLDGLARGKMTRKTAFSIILSATGLIWIILASSVITYFNPSALGTKWEWGEFGSSPGEIVFNMLANPLRAIQILFNDGQRKFLYLESLLGPLAFFPLLDPLPLIMALPWLAASLLSINPNYYAIENQYPAFVSAFIFFSAVRGMARIRLDSVEALRRISFLMLISFLITTLLLPTGVYLKAEADGAMDYAVKMITPYSSASVMPEVFPHLSNRLEVYPYFRVGVDYALINVYSWWYEATLPRPAHTAPRWCDADLKGYGIVVNAEGVLLYKRGYNGPVRLFKGVKLTFKPDDVEAVTGRIYQDNVLLGGVESREDVLAHKTEDSTPLFFRVPVGVLPPGIYNATVILKISSKAPLRVIDLEVLKLPERAKIFSKTITGLDFLDAVEWQAFNFSFTVKKPIAAEIEAYVTDSMDVYFYSLTLFQTGSV